MLYWLKRRRLIPSTFLNKPFWLRPRSLQGLAVRPAPRRVRPLAALSQEQTVKDRPPSASREQMPRSILFRQQLLAMMQTLHGLLTSARSARVSQVVCGTVTGTAMYVRSAIILVANLIRRTLLEHPRNLLRHHRSRNRDGPAVSLAPHQVRTLASL